jgi:predicted RNase H-like HicB family nuclease
MISRLSRSWGAALSRLSHMRGDDASGGEDLGVLRVHVEYDALDKAFIAKCIDLPGCASYGATQQEAIENVIEAITGVLNVRLQTRAREEVERQDGRGDCGVRDLALAL